MLSSPHDHAAAEVVASAAHQAGAHAAIACRAQLLAAVRVKELLDEGRRRWLAERGWSPAELCRLVGEEISAENTLLLARAPARVEGTVDDLSGSKPKKRRKTADVVAETAFVSWSSTTPTALGL